MISWCASKMSIWFVFAENEKKEKEKVGYVVQLQTTYEWRWAVYSAKCSGIVNTEEEARQKVEEAYHEEQTNKKEKSVLEGT